MGNEGEKGKRAHIESILSIFSKRRTIIFRKRWTGGFQTKILQQGMEKNIFSIQLRKENRRPEDGCVPLGGPGHHDASGPALRPEILDTWVE
jgi:hypothetical protein